MYEFSWRTVAWGILLGITFHVGWGIVTLVLWVLAKAMGVEDQFPVLPGAK
jgi:TM2 domain-containing membrane protein YozV